MSLNQTANAVRQQIEQYAANIIGCLEELPDKLIWSPGPDGSNSIGTLTHHLSGNLHHFLGAGILEDGYQRDRPAEFSDHGLTVQELIDELNQALGVARKALETLDAQRIDAPHTSVDGREFPSTAHMLLLIVAHFAYHTGQINYTARIWREKG
jgi:uncharacterized damage-inducible protein DinB